MFAWRRPGALTPCHLVSGGLVSATADRRRLWAPAFAGPTCCEGIADLRFVGLARTRPMADMANEA